MDFKKDYSCYKSIIKWLPSLVWLALMLFKTVLIAQTPLRIFEQVGLNDKGRPFYTSITQDIMTDRLGRIWYSTIGSGIIRYDGYNYQQFQYDWQDSTTISGNRVVRLIEDKDGNIWTVSYTGVDRLNVRTGKFTRFGMPKQTKRVNAIHQCTPSTFLLGTDNGLWELDANTKQFVLWTHKGVVDSAGASKRILDFHQDQSGRFRAASSAGVLVLYPNERSYDLFPVSITNKPDCKKIFQTQKGLFWVATESGLFQYFPESQTFAPSGLPDSISNYRFTDIEEGPDASLWLSGGLGVIHWIPSTKTVEHFYSPDKSQGLFPGVVGAICLDRLGNLWLSTKSGLRKTNIKPPSFQLYQVVQGRDERANQICWAINDALGGLLLYNGVQLHYANKLGTEPELIALPAGKRLLSFSNYAGKTPEGDICVSWANGGLGVWNPMQKKFKMVLSDTCFNGKAIQTQCYDRDNKDLMWVGTADGLWQIQRKTGVKKYFQPTAFVNQNRTINEIADDGKGGLWCQMIGGIAYFDRRTEQFTMLDRHYISSDSLIIGEILDIAVDHQGTLWVAYLGGLAKILRSAAGTFNYTAFTSRNGLPDNSLTALEIDDEGYIWIGFNNPFLVRMHPQTYEMVYCDIMNAVSTRPHIRKALHQSTGGSFYYFAMDGLVVFNPLHMRRDSIPPELVLTSVIVNNKRQDIQAEFTKEIVLNAADNAIAFEFVGIHLSSPNFIRYQYQLLGYDTGWVNCPSDLRRVGYTNLTSGGYRFLLRAANPDGVWSEPKEMIRFIINPYFWQTSWFRFLIIMIVSAILYGVLYNRLQQRRLLEEKTIAEQSARYKSQFLANMSHEIRTPMNAILGLSRLLDESTLDIRQKKFMNAIRHSSEDLLRIVNDILDYSKIESGQFTFHAEPFDLFEVINLHVQEPFAFYAEEKGIGFSINIEKNVPSPLIGDAVRLTQILTNLIGNAIKFTDSGKVMLTVSRVGTDESPVKIQFVVTDTGTGIPMDKQTQVFERFNQLHAGDATAKGGTGLGLSIAKQLVEQQGGGIILTSQVGQGTSVSFWLDFLLPEEDENAKRIVNKLDLSKLQNITVLLVEDTYFNQLLALELLTTKVEGIQIEVAENGQIALDKLVSNTFDLILMDVKMPVMDGLEATRRIRAFSLDHPSRNIPIVGLTANAIPDELEKCTQAGMDYWVTKPIQADELLSAMQQAIEKKR